MKKVTSKEVAQLAGVSQTTVSLILNNKNTRTFSPETCERVWNAAQQLGYQLPLRTTAPAKHHQPVIAVLTPTLSNPYYTHLIQIIEHHASTQGYKVIFGNTSRDPDTERYYLDFFTASQVSGIIYTFLPSFPSLVNQLASKMPIVLIGEKENQLRIPSIELSNIKSGELMARHLLSLNHTHFAFVSTSLQNVTLARQQRLEGVQSALTQAGLPSENLILLSHSTDELDTSSNNVEYELGVQAAREIVTLYPHVTAVIGVNDMTSIGLLKGFEQMGISVPKQYSVCGFDNIMVSAISNPELTTIDHHLELRGETAVNMILEYDIDTSPHTAPAPPVSKIEYEPRLLIRKSTAPVREA
ncbi:MAG: LacI family DNA-binding transcriptional regulator [Eubacteriales bacterium]|jgi:LacI family transcriptional regulator